MDIDNDTLELLENRLSDKVESRVRRRLFGIYGAAATAFLGAFGYFGYDTVTTARTAVEEGSAEMREAIGSLQEKAEQYAQEAVAGSVVSATEAAEDAQRVADTAATRLKVIDEWMAARTLRLAEIEGDVAAALGKVESVSGRIQDELDRMTAKITDTETQITAQQERARELYAGAGNLDGLKSDIATLTDQVAALEQSLRALRQAEAPDDGTPDGTAALPTLPQVELDAKFSQLSEKYTAFTAAQMQPPPQVTVYFQFAGVARDVAEDISSRLRQQNYQVPGEERIGTAAGKSEVRYFFDEDRERALALAAAVNRVLEDTGYRSDVASKDLTGFTGAKPRPGTLELWLEPVPAR